MTAETDFTRALRAWLQEDAHEDPGRVLDRVAAAVAQQPQDRPTRGLGVRGGPSSRLGVAAVMAAVIVVIGLAFVVPPLLVGPGPTGSPSLEPTESSPSPSPAESAPTSTASVPPFDPSVPSIANDAPCTRHWPAGSFELQPVAFHHEDLERMVLSSDDVGGLDGYEPDVFRQGYHDNAELASLEIGPPTTCDDIHRLGRIEGYANAYSSSAEPSAVTFAVHLFWTPDEAAEWVETFTDGLTEAAEAGGATFEAITDGLSIPDATLYEHVGPEGTRTWAIIVRGPIVGWVVDLHADEATIDVPAAATEMAARIETVAAEVADRPRSGLDAAQLLSAPLPGSEYGPLAADFAWDPFFGGCQDAAERGFIVGPKAVTDAQRFGRITGCTAMYAPVASSGEVERVFSIVQVHRDPTGASAALAEMIADQEGRGGVRFAASVGDEAIGIATPAGSGEGGGPADTRVVFRLGALLLVVAIQGSTAGDQQPYVLDLADRLEARIRAVIAGA